MLQQMQSTKNQQEQRKNIKIIAHRGQSYFFPQNTQQAIIAGLHSSDFVQFDVLFTKDNQVVVFHDRGLSRLTDIQSYPQYANRFSQQCIEKQKEMQRNWWIRDFTFEELRKLNVRQPALHRPQLLHNFKISKLQEIIEQSLKIKNRPQHRNLPSGLLIQLKSEIVNQTSKQDYQMCNKIIDILKRYQLNSPQDCSKKNLPIIIQSFNIQMLKYIQNQCKNPIIQLYSRQTIITQTLLLQNKSRQTIGIGVTQQSLLNSQRQLNRNILQICGKLGYQLFYWTIRHDESQIPFKCRNYVQVYRMLQLIGVTGFITQLPNICKGIFKIQSAKYAADNEQNGQQQLKNDHSNNKQNKSQ